MLPVHDNNVVMIDLNKESLDKNIIQYQSLLKGQLFWLNRNINKLYLKSEMLYDSYINDTLDKNIKDRCCNFKLLEEKCEEYNKELISV